MLGQRFPFPLSHIFGIRSKPVMTTYQTHGIPNHCQSYPQGHTLCTPGIRSTHGWPHREKKPKTIRSTNTLLVTIRKTDLWSIHVLLITQETAHTSAHTCFSHTHSSWHTASCAAHSSRNQQPAVLVCVPQWADKQMWGLTVLPRLWSYGHPAPGRQGQLPGVPGSDGVSLGREQDPGGRL